ncbi:hypothetical protein B0H34DRAFT_515420 [Crassisporium funariophilum]|nr:hypothetical protein B0H34DRAFT_515420 [Crassisporium funariophilum]
MRHILSTSSLPTPFTCSLARGWGRGSRRHARADGRRTNRKRIGESTSGHANENTTQSITIQYTPHCTTRTTPRIRIRNFGFAALPTVPSLSPSPFTVPVSLSPLLCGMWDVGCNLEGPQQLAPLEEEEPNVDIPYLTVGFTVAFLRRRHHHHHHRHDAPEAVLERGR